MDSARSLMEQARSLENGGQHRPALDLYTRILQESDRPDPALVIRVANLHVRLGGTAQAVDAYLRAADLLQRADLLHGAIALLRRAVALDPARVEVWLQLGRLSARAGLATDARTWLARYVEHMEGSGRAEQGWSELRDHLRSRPGDTEIRRLLIERLEAHGQPAAEEERRALDAGAGTERPAEDRREADAAPFDDGLQILGNEWGGADSLPAHGEPAETLDILATRLDGFDTSHGPGDGGLGAEPARMEGLESTSLGLDRIEYAPSAPDEPLSLLGSDPSPEEFVDGGRMREEDEWEGSGLDDLPLLGPDPFEVVEPGRAQAGEPLPTFGGLPEVDPVPSLQARVDRDPTDVDAHRALVDLLGQRGEAEPLAAALERAHPWLAAAGRHVEAEEMVVRLAELRPEIDQLAVLRVEYAVRTGDASRACAALLAFGARLVGRSRLARAREVFARVLEMDPGNEEARRALAALPASTPLDR